MFVTISDVPVEGFNYFDYAFRFVENDWDELLRTVKVVEKYPRYFGAQQLKTVIFKMRSEYNMFRSYYRDYALPGAVAMSDRLHRDFHSSEHKYPEFPLTSEYFNNPIKDAIHAGYVGINHKLESFVAFARAHSKGKAYGPLGKSPLPKDKLVQYEQLLTSRYGISLGDMTGKDASPTLCEECDKELPSRAPTEPSTRLYPIIDKVRLIANRVKHQSGYARNENDLVMEQLFEQNPKKPIQPAIEVFCMT